MDLMDISNTQFTTQDVSQMDMDDEMDFYDSEEALNHVPPLGGGYGGYPCSSDTMMTSTTQTLQGSPMDTATQDTTGNMYSTSTGGGVSNSVDGEVGGGVGVGGGAHYVRLPDFTPSRRHIYLNCHSLRHMSSSNLGSGSFGSVTMGIVSDGAGRSRRVAIKHAQGMSRSEACKAIKKEIAVFEKVPAHRNIVEYIGGRVGSPGDDMANASDFFIVEELLHGNLNTLIHEDSSFALRVTYRDLILIFHAIVTGLTHLHTHSVIHHDLKPSNVLMTKDLVPKLADFGASTIRLRKSITATMRGTPGYIAPEAYYGGLVKQVSGGKVKVNESIDIFSLGAMMWECIVREPIGGIENSQATQEELKESQGVDEGPFIQWGCLTRVKCNCPKPLRDMVEACLRFDHDNISTMDFKRPTCEDISSRLLSMMKESWIMERPPWKL